MAATTDVLPFGTLIGRAVDVFRFDTDTETGAALLSSRRRVGGGVLRAVRGERQEDNSEVVVLEFSLAPSVRLEQPLYYSFTVT